MIDDKNRPPLILLVDDMPTNLHVLSAALRDDYRIKVATNGKSALQIAKEAGDPPQLILLDVMMPGMSGIDVMRELRNDPLTLKIPVIFVSADTSEQSQLDGLSLGADDYLIKPVANNILRVRVRNLIQRRQAEAQLRLAAHVFEFSGEAIMITDSRNRIIEVNRAFTRLTGYAIEEVRGRDPSILSSGRVSGDFYREMWNEILTTGFWQGEMWDRHKSGGTYPKLLTISVVRDESDEIEYFIASFTDIRDQKANEEKIRHVAHHDSLTGLPNRLHLQIHLDQMVASAQREEDEVAVMFIDLDRFKMINDTLGHHIGDELLIEVAKRLHSAIRDSDFIARLGGDEFVVVLRGRRLTNTSVSVAEKMIERIAEPLLIKGNTLHTSPSIGISIYPHDGSSSSTLMKNADTAMYHAKSLGRNNFQFFSAGMNQVAADRLQLESSLHAGLEEEQFILHYQPQIEVESGRVVGVEALIRWNHPEQGMIPPDRFIPVAEEIGLICPIGEWVARNACAQLASWRESGLPSLRMAINLSLHQLRNADLVTRVERLMAEHGLTGDDIELEITESSAMHHPEATIRTLSELRDLGIGLAIDDFGTGYSSLNYLKLLPIQYLKLDRTFVKDIETNPHDAAICTATIAMAHALGLSVIAEGVETIEQRDYLAGLGCDQMQGYLFSRPVPADKIEQVIGGIEESIQNG